jgi:hypothetical protein
MTEEGSLSVPAAFSPGRTLNVSFGVFGRNLPAFLTITTVLSLPYIVLQTWLDFATIEAADGGGGLAAANFGIFLVYTVTFGLVQAAVTYGTVQDLRGQPAGVAACFGRGLARSGNIASGAVQAGLLLGIATLLLIVPGVILYLRWWVFMPAMVVEELTPSDAFVRSKNLTAGRRWAILGLAALILVVEFAVLFGLVMIIEGIAGAFAITLLAVFFSSFTSVVAAVGYYHLRVEKEGVMIDDIAKVFD